MDGLAQDCGNFIASTPELPQSSVQPSIHELLSHAQCEWHSQSVIFTFWMQNQSRRRWSCGSRTLRSVPRAFLMQSSTEPKAFIGPLRGWHNVVDRCPFSLQLRAPRSPNGSSFHMLIFFPATGPLSDYWSQRQFSRNTTLQSIHYDHTIPHDLQYSWDHQLHSANVRAQLHAGPAHA